MKDINTNISGTLVLAGVEYVPREGLTELRKENENLKNENNSLKAHIRKMQEDIDLSVSYSNKFAELNDRHQQDCIRFNNMRIAFLAAIDELAKLRKQFGVEQ